MDGFLIINKEKGYTSHDVVNILRKILKTKKIGHTGTLDPNTTGVLVIAIGEATKLLPYLTEKKKHYKCRVLLGKSTDTEDITGDVIESNTNFKLSNNDILEIVPKIMALKEQIPPMYSSVKINGKKLYEYARQGIVIERVARPIEVYSMQLLSELVYTEDGYAYFDFELVGSKGIYIRTICTKIGELLNIPSTMMELERISSGKFHLKDSLLIEQVKSNNYELISILDALDLPKVEAKSWDVKSVENGSKILDRYNVGYPFCITIDGKLKAIYDKSDENYCKSLKGFNYDK